MDSRQLLLHNVEDLQVNNNVYKILNKNSASPTIVVLDLVNKIAYKLWVEQWTTDEQRTAIEAVEYERKVYATKIQKLYKKFGSKCPILPSIGEFSGSVNDFLKHIGAVGALRYPLLIALHGYFHRQFNPALYYTAENLKKLVHSTPDLTEQSINKFAQTKKLKGIGTLMINNSTTLHDQIEKGEAENSGALLAQVVLGIFMIYNSGLQHNDLHDGNILVANHGTKVQIYDWDRAYMEGIPNSFTDANPCGDSYCSRGAVCNTLFPNGYSIDLFRICASLLSTREAFFPYFLQNVFNVMNFGGMVHRQVQEILQANSWFYDPQTQCNYLAESDTPRAKYLYRHFGSIDSLFVNMNSDYSTTLRNNNINVPEAYEYVQQFRDLIPADASDEMLKDQQTRLNQILIDGREKRAYYDSKFTEINDEIRRLQEQLFLISEDVEQGKAIGVSMLTEFNRIKASLSQGDYIRAFNMLKAQEEKFNKSMEKKAEITEKINTAGKQQTAPYKSLLDYNRLVQAVKNIIIIKTKKTNLLERMEFTKTLQNTINQYIITGNEFKGDKTNFQSILRHPDEYKLLIGLSENWNQFNFTAVETPIDTQSKIKNEKNILQTPKQMTEKGKIDQSQLQIMRDKLEELKNIPPEKATYENAFLLRYITNYLEYGPPVPVSVPQQENTKPITEKPSWEIMFK